MVKGKRGQFQISFGMIFSIILIVMFLVVAFITIKSFFGVRCSAEEGIFLKDLQNEVDRIWRGSGAQKTFEGDILGCEIDYVCFWETPEINGEFSSFAEDDFSEFTGDEGNHNLYFYPRRNADVPSTLIKHLNLTSLTDNPVCFKKEGDKFKIPLKKNLGESLVRVSG